MFKDAIKEPFDPNDVIDCLVNVVWPAFIEHNGGVVPDRPTIEKVRGIGKLPIDTRMRGWRYHQMLSYLYDRHENQQLEIVNAQSLKHDLMIYMPIIRSTEMYDVVTVGKSDNEVADALIEHLTEVEEPKLRASFDARRTRAVSRTVRRRR